MEETLLSKNLNDLDDIVKSIISFAGSCKMWLFYGEMGAGKTTLISKLCEALKVTSHVSSPTFSIVNEYRNINDLKIFHFDFYRIKSEVEAMDIGYEEYFYSGDYCLIEWPEKIPNLLPEKFIRIEVKINNDNSRLIHLSRT